MICDEPRIVNICKELFNFLKSDKLETDLHTKTITKITRASVIQTEISVGFMTLRMVWKPLKREGGVDSGTDEGAQVFIYLPFSEGDERFEVKGYYSERGSKPLFRVIVQDAYKSSPYGVRRVVPAVQVSDTNPLG